MRKMELVFALAVGGCACLSPLWVFGAEGAGAGLGVVSPDPNVWQPMTVDFRGPTMGQTDSGPNPFLDYRLQVLFIGPSGQRYDVPGFFDGDGKGGKAGGVWRVRFAPDEAGEWRYTASFRTGPEIAVSLEPAAGTSAAFDGTGGSFGVGAADGNFGAFYAWGRLEYVGKHYLKFRNGPYWIRGGTDSPEDFLAYAGFVNTPPSHKYADHVSDWREGDPDWDGGKGRAIIGAINYLAGKHVNSLYFLTMNIGGDGGNVWPWVGTPNPKGHPGDDNLHFDLTKLAQWGTVLDHAQRRGLFLHFVFNEAEERNKRELDDGELGTERKLYYREILARFGHHLALQWNLCEEYNIGLDLGHDRVRAFADYLRAVDPYDHPITVHPAREPIEALEFIFGDERFSMTSIQIGQRNIDTLTEAFREGSASAGRPIPISMDEFTIEKGQARAALPINDAARLRKEKLWPTYLSGGNIEFILEDLLGTESFKTPELDKLWHYVWYARKFMEESLPFWEMEHADGLVSGAASIKVSQLSGGSHDMDAQVFAKPGEVYAIYLPDASQTGTLDLTGHSGTFGQQWYNPRTGQFVGEARQLSGGGAVALGGPPSEAGEDWAVLVERE